MEGRSGDDGTQSQISEGIKLIYLFKAVGDNWRYASSQNPASVTDQDEGKIGLSNTWPLTREGPLANASSIAGESTTGILFKYIFMQGP